MNFLEEAKSSEEKVTTPDWLHHAGEAKKYKGSYASYCRAQGIDYDQFMYHKDKLRNSVKANSANSQVKEGFAKVNVAPLNSGASNINHQLPDSKWLAEFIYNLLRVR